MNATLVHKYFHPAWVGTAGAPTAPCPPLSVFLFLRERGAGLLFKGKELNQASCVAVISLPAVSQSTSSQVRGYVCEGLRHRCSECGGWESEESWTEMGAPCSWDLRAPSLGHPWLTHSSTRPTERSSQRGRPKKGTLGSRGVISSVWRVTFEPFLSGSRDGPGLHGSPWEAAVGPQPGLPRAGGANPARQNSDGSGGQRLASHRAGMLQGDLLLAGGANQ